MYVNTVNSHREIETYSHHVSQMLTTTGVAALSSEVTILRGGHVNPVDFPVEYRATFILRLALLLWFP